ncbi:MAG TPA: cation transporter, partial [Candidatus Methylomirabilis sp.]|nr:cation transporter [Candidatus Methylomirabilis sp.]
MDERTIELEIPLLLPGLQDEADGCLARLETALQAQKGLTRAHLERDRRPVTLCLHYDPDSLSLADVKRLAQGAGAQIIDRFHHLLLPIEGMDCSDCVDVIEHSLGRIEGVLSVGVSFPMETVRVEFDAHTTDRHAIEKRIRSLGYTVPASETEQRFQENRELLLTLLSGVLLAAGWAGEAFFG